MKSEFFSLNRYRFRGLLGLFVLGVFLHTVQGAQGQQNSLVGDDKSAPAETQGPKPAATPANRKPTPTPTPRGPSELQKALNEFRIQMGSGGNAGKSLSKIKTGGRQNSLTGRIYENFRNDFLDAIPHQVRQRGGTKSLLRRNQYGFSLSGPVVLPKVYDGRGKTFFSASFEGTRERIAQSALFTIPTLRQQAGDFSDLVDSAGNPVKIYDPTTTRPNPAYDPSQPVSAENLQYLRDPFPGNKIPENRLDPVARAITSLYAKPNTAVGPFLQNNYWINSPFENQADGMIAKLDHTVSSKQQVSFNFNFSDGQRKSPEYFPGPANSGAPSYDFQSGSLSFQDNYTATPNIVWTIRASASVGTTTQLNNEDATDHPRALGLKGIFSKYFPRVLFSNNFLSIGPQAAGIRDRSYTYAASASVSINRKNHTWRYTALGQRRYVNSYGPAYPAGYFYFGGALTGLPGVRNTGNSFAQFLLGEVTRGEESIVVHPSYYRRNFFDFNAADEYRVRPGLTATFSLSVEVASPRTEKYDRQSTVSLDHINPVNGKPGALIFAGRDGVGRALQPTTVRFEPSLGLSINPWNDRKTVVRMNYSLSYEEVPMYGRHFGTQGFNASPIFITPNEQLQSAFRLRQGVPTNFPLPPDLDPAAVNGIEPDYFDTSGQLPANQTWTASLQRELPRALAVEARYTGTKVTHQFVDGAVRLNAVPLSALQYGEQLYDDSFRNSLRPYPQYRTFDVGGLFPGGDYEAHFLTVTVDQRLLGGFFGRASYRFGKQMDNYSSGTPQDPYNRQAEWSLSTGDVKHSFQLSYTFELPFGKGKKLFRDGGILASSFGGWSISGLTTLAGGTPLSIRPLFNRSGGLVGNLRANVVSGVDPKVEDPNPDRWFNPDAFAQPDDFTLGNGPRTHPDLRAPGEQFHHLSVTKRVELNADTSLEFVTEAFNFPNHANWNDPDTRIGPASSPNLNAGKIIGSTGGRVMQLGMRILF